MNVSRIDFGTGYRKNCLFKNAMASNPQQTSQGGSVSFGMLRPDVKKINTFTTIMTGTKLVGPIKRLCQDKSLYREVRELEEKMRNMGYIARFEDDFNSAKIITDVYGKMNERGIRLPKEVVMFEPDRPTLLHYKPVAISGEEMPLLYAKNFTKRTVEVPKDFANKGVKAFSTEAPEGTVYRAIGEFLNQGRINNPDRAEKWFYATNSNLDMLREVGYYPIMEHDAQTSRKYLPFLAEVFAGRMTGKQFSPQTMKLYEELGGIIL